MKQSTKDEVKGDLREAKGAVKERAGRATNVPNVAAEGHAERLAGRAQAKAGEIEAAMEK